MEFVRLFVCLGFIAMAGGFFIGLACLMVYRPDAMAAIGWIESACLFSAASWWLAWRVGKACDRAEDAQEREE